MTANLPSFSSFPLLFRKVDTPRCWFVVIVFLWITYTQRIRCCFGRRPSPARTLGCLPAKMFPSPVQPEVGKQAWVSELLAKGGGSNSVCRCRRVVRFESSLLLSRLGQISLDPSPPACYIQDTVYTYFYFMAIKHLILPRVL